MEEPKDPRDIYERSVVQIHLQGTHEIGSFAGELYKALLKRFLGIGPGSKVGETEEISYVWYNDRGTLKLSEPYRLDDPNTAELKLDDVIGSIRERDFSGLFKSQILTN